ncbi:hypothetical protein ACFLV9_00815 [Chloroflexota bacterium]
MSGKPNVGEIIKEQRKRLSLFLEQLSKLSGISVAHFEVGLRQTTMVK